MEKTEWTISTLKEFFDDRFKSLERSIDKAEGEQKDHNEESNQYRKQLADQATEFYTKYAEQTNVYLRKDDYGKRHDELADKIELAAHNLTDKQGAINDAMNKRMEILTNRLTVIEGKGLGLNAGWQYLLAVLFAGSAVFNIFEFFSKK